MPFLCLATHNYRLVFLQPLGYGGYLATDAAFLQHCLIFLYWQKLAADYFCTAHEQGLAVFAALYAGYYEVFARLITRNGWGAWPSMH